MGTHRHESRTVPTPLTLGVSASLRIGDYAGSIEEATDLFERFAGLANDAGLFAEEYSLRNEQFLWNFPQAFTYLGPIAADQRLRECSARFEPACQTRDIPGIRHDP